MASAVASSGQRKKFRQALPEGYFVDPNDLEGLSRYLSRRGWLAPDEELSSVEKAGEGNMNLTLRVVSSHRSFILKQARPWVEKYPHIPAPPGRALVEVEFYRSVARRPAVRQAMPRLLGDDRRSGVLALEDLGVAQDFTSLYAGRCLSGGELDALLAYLAALHPPFGDELDGASRRRLSNTAMRRLNHEHIFHLPLLKENGLDLDALTPGLNEESLALKHDPRYVRTVSALGNVFLSEGASLVHGDYFPGSWLETHEGIRVIDPEFCFLGAPAFDLGVLTAHLYLADQPESLTGNVAASYRRHGGEIGKRTETLSRQFAGVEIMRRLIGVAQLPLGYGLEKKRQLLHLSRALVLRAKQP